MIILSGDTVKFIRNNKTHNKGCVYCVGNMIKEDMHCFVYFNEKDGKSRIAIEYSGDIITERVRILITEKKYV